MTTFPIRPGTGISSTNARVNAYWVATLVLAAECIVGGVWGALRLSPFIDVALHLGYPAYFMTILGAWYLLAGIVLLAPGLPRLKEWAYAGLIVNYTGAAASHLWVGDGAGALLGPAVFAGLTVASWALRPPARRDFQPNPLVSSRSRTSAYWVTTALVAAELSVGGVWDLLRIDLVREVVESLGYPAYLLTIMGFWKLLGAAALLVPGLPRTKEWAYAGAVIVYVCAVVSHLTVGTGIDTLAAPMVFLALTTASWALHRSGSRPPNSVPGELQRGR